MKRFILIMICLLSALLFLASCSSGSPSSSTIDIMSPSASSAPSVSSGGGSGAAAPGSSSGGANGSMAAPGSDFTSGNNSTEQGLAQLPILTPSEASGKKLIYTLTLRLQTTEFMQGLRKLLDTVSDVGGYLMAATVEGRDMRYPEIERSGNYEFRVPTERLQDLLIMVENNYNLWRLQQTAEDVTPKYDRYGIQLGDLLEQEQRLLDALNTIEDATERLDTERMLSEIQKQISEFYTYQISVDDSVMFAAVYVQLYEVIFFEEEIAEPLPPPKFSERLSSRVSNSVDAFVAFCQGFLLFIIAVAPVLVIIVVIGILIMVILRGVKKYRKKRSPAPPSYTHAEPPPIPSPISPDPPPLQPSTFPQSPRSPQPSSPGRDQREKPDQDPNNHQP